MCFFIIMNKIYFGKYIELEKPSLIHLLNPLNKLIIISISAALIFYFGRNIYSYAFMSFMWFILIFLSGRIFRQAFSAIKSFKMLYLFLLQCFFLVKMAAFLYISQKKQCIMPYYPLISLC